jgi:protocatechuate 3,4-dioxygenase beta subunit
MTKAAIAGAVVLAGGVLFLTAWERSGAHRSDAAAPALPELLTASERIASADPVRRDDVAPAVREVAAADAEAAGTIGGIALRGSDPLPGALVRVRIVEGFEGEGAVLHDRLVHADARGRFEVACTRPAKGVRVRADGEMPGYTSWEREVLVPRTAQLPQDLVVQLDPLDVEARGSVTSESGAAIAGATVSVQGGGVATTDHDGRFTVRGTSVRAEMRVTASAPGFAERGVVLQVSGPGACDDVEIVLAASALLRGRVVDERGAPVAGATVSAVSADRAITRTDAEGRFALDGLPRVGEWLALRVVADGFAAANLSLASGRVPDVPLEIVLASGLDLRGRVVDPAGAPVPGTHVFAGAEPDDLFTVHGWADDEGEFTLRGVPRDELAYGAVAEGYAPFTAVRDPQRDAGELLIVLDRGATVTGRVVDQNGAPVARAGVALLERDHIYVPGARAHTDSDGGFTLRGVPDGELTLECWAAGFARHQQPLHAAQSGSIVVQLVRAAGLAGRVVDARTGAPVTSFRVRFVPIEGDATQPRLSGYSATWSRGVEFRDPNGAWDTRGEELTAGEATALEITAPGYGTAVVARAITTTDPELARIEVALDAGVRVSGRVVDARDGRPIAGAVVRRFTPRDEYGVWRDDGDAERAQTVTDAAGEFRFAGLPHEPMSLLVVHPGFATSADGPFAPDRETAPREIALTPGATVRGALRDASGAPVPHAKVELAALRVAGAQGRSWICTTDDAGAFSFAQLPPGEYQISHRLEHENGAVYDLPRALTLDAQSDHGVELRPPGSAVVRGMVIGSDVPPEVLVFARRVDGAGAASPEGTRRAAIARDGRFSINGCTAGRWEISVSEAGVFSAPARRASREVDVAAGALVEIELELPTR